MANYYTNFCIQARYMGSDTVKWIVSTLDLANEIISGDENASPDELRKLAGQELADSILSHDDIGFELIKEGADTYLESGESGNLDNVCLLLQEALRRKDDPTLFVDFQWSCSSSRLNPESEGGGAAFITADEIRTFSTNEWINQQIAARTDTLGRSSPKV